MAGFEGARDKAVALAGGVGLVAGALVTRPGPAPALEYPKIFVVGCPRSGTTWVAGILALQPRVIHGAESQLYPSIRHSIGGRRRFDPVGWARLLYGVDRGRRIGLESGLHHYLDRRTLERLGRQALATGGSADEVSNRLARAVLDSYFTRSGGTADSVLVEKTPSHIFAAARILRAFPEAHVVEVVRDGRDVCVSMQLRGTRVRSFPTTAEGRIRMWMNAVRAGQELQRDPQLCDRVTEIRYETLKADPVSEIARLYAAVGLDASPDFVRYAAASSDIERYPTGPGEFRHRGEVGTWADFFSPEDEDLFRSMVGDRFEEFGYSY